MPKFTDAQGREYDCLVSVATAITLKKQYALNLMEHFDGSLWDRLAADPELLVNVLAETVRPSLTQHGLDEAAFAGVLDGNTLAAAVAALQEAITDFSPPPKRAALKRIQEKADLVQTLGLERLNLEIDTMTPETIRAEMEARIVAEKLRRSTLNNSAGSTSPSAEPASTPG